MLHLPPRLKIDRYPEVIKSRTEPLKFSGGRICIVNLAARFSVAGFWVIIWLEQVMRTLKRGSFYVHLVAALTAASSCLRSGLSRIRGRRFAGRVTKSGQTPLFGWQGWELPSSAVRREHLCSRSDVCSATEQISFPQPSVVTASVTVQGRSGIEKEGGRTWGGSEEA